MADPILLIELKWALKKAKNRKSPGGNDTPVELYKLLNNNKVPGVNDDYHSIASDSMDDN